MFYNMMFRMLVSRHKPATFALSVLLLCVSNALAFLGRHVRSIYVLKIRRDEIETFLRLARACLDFQSAKYELFFFEKKKINKQIGFGTFADSEVRKSLRTEN